MRAQFTQKIPRQPPHWSLHQRRPSVGNTSLWLLCVLGSSTSKTVVKIHVHQHGSQPPGPQPTPVSLVCIHLVVFLWPTACSCSAFTFLPHWTFLLSDHHIFSPSYQKSAPNFPLLIPLLAQMLLPLTLFPHREKQPRKPGLQSCENCYQSCHPGYELTRFQRIKDDLKWDVWIGQDLHNGCLWLYFR